MLFAKSLSLIVYLSLIAAGKLAAQVNITTWQVDLQHTGNNASEKILSPGIVSSPGNFGLLFSQPMDGQTYGQPLFISGVMIGGVAHNVVYAATEHCSLYAFDGDNNSGGNAAPLWKVSLLPSGTVPVPQSVVGSGDIPTELGITTTPVIDPVSKTIYIVSKVQRTSDTSYHQYLYALDLATGATKFGSPVELNPTFPGTSTPDSVGGVVLFNPLREHLRSAMILHNGIIYLAFASHSDTSPYHGEIVGYDATTLQLVRTFIATPNGGTPKGGIWQSGAGPAVDQDGNMYVAVGNGAWDQNNSSYGTNWGESMLKLPTTGPFTVNFNNPLNWFTPNNWNTLNGGDLDLGSGGLLILPDQAGPHPHIMVGGGKGAVLYIVDRDNMGGLQTPDAAIQEIPEPEGKWLFVTPAYYNGYIYYSASGGQLEQRAVGYDPTDGSYISPSPITSTDTFNNKGSGCFISSDGTTDGIVWLLTGNGVKAYDATNIAGNPIFSANATIPGNITCSTTKFSLPMVANGKLYFTGYNNTTVGHLLVYGLLPTGPGTPAGPTNADADASSAQSLSINWTSNSDNESGFKIKRSTSATGTFTQVGSTGAGITTYTDGGLTPQTTYYYQVIATNANGDSNASNVTSATTFPLYAENGLIAYWDLDELNVLTVSDVTGKGHTGTINGEADLETGFINNGINLHGTGQATSNVTVANKSDLQFSASQSFTLSAWLFPASLRGSDEAVIAKSRDQGNYYGIWINPGNHWVFRGPGGDVIGPAATESAWSHIAVVQNGAANTRTIYLNGVAMGTGTAQAADGTGALWIGQQNLTGNLASFPGNVDEVRLYNRALAASEISSLMGPPVLEATSSLAHGNAGTFASVIAPSIVNQLESREGSPTGQYSIVLYFSAPVSGLQATLRRKDSTAPAGHVSAVNYDNGGRIITVTLSDVGNAQALLLHLTGIMPGSATTDIPFNVFWGDVNHDNIVNSLDLALTQNSHTILVNPTNSIYDLNADGTVNSVDDALASDLVGTSFGAQTDTDLAVFQPTTALSNIGGNIPANSVDRNALTRWESIQKVDPQWIYVDLGTSSTIHTVILNWENAAGKDYNIEVSSNASSWTAIKQVSGNTSAGIYTYSGLNAVGRYVRMYGITRDSDYGYSLYDFQVLGVYGTGAVDAPTVNSSAAAYALTGSVFSYQITGTNTPTSYGATGLPLGLSVNTSTGLISGTPSKAGTYSVTISASNPSGTGTSTLTMNVQTSFIAWKSFWFSADESYDPNVSGPLASPAGDGISNLMKYALNLPPKTNGSTGLPVSSLTSIRGQNYLTLTYTKVIAAIDVVYQPEVSGDMQSWSSDAPSVIIVSVTNNADGKTQTVVARDATAINSTGQRFIRLRITQL